MRDGIELYEQSSWITRALVRRRTITGLQTRGSLALKRIARWSRPSQRLAERVLVHVKLAVAGGTLAAPSAIRAELMVITGCLILVDLDSHFSTDDYSRWQSPTSESSHERGGMNSTVAASVSMGDEGVCRLAPQSSTQDQTKR